jgi:Bacterial Alpha-2-macroglobulin MG10 domain/Alpha-2-macroglobulin family/MG2 domain
MFRSIIILSLFTFMSTNPMHANEKVFVKPAAPRDIRKPISYPKYTTERAKLAKLQEDGLSRDAVEFIKQMLVKAGVERNHTEFYEFFSALQNEISNGLYEEEELPAFDKFIEDLIPTLASPSKDFALLFFVQERAPLMFEDSYRMICGKPALSYEEQNIALRAKRKDLYSQIYSHKYELITIPYDEIFLDADTATIIESPSLYEYFVDVTNYFAYKENQDERYDVNQDEKRAPLLITKQCYGTIDATLIQLIPCTDLIGCDSKFQRMMFHLIEMENYHFRQKRYESAGRYAILRLKMIQRIEEQYEFNEKYQFSEDLISYEQKEQVKNDAFIAHQKFYGKTKASNLFTYYIAQALYVESNKYDEGRNTAVTTKATEALSILNEALTKFPNGYRNKSLIELRNQIVNPQIQFKLLNNVGLEKPMLMRLQYTNINKAFLKIVRFSTLNRNIADSSCKYEIISERILTLENDENHLTHTKEFVLDGILKTGNYAVYIINSDENWIENLKKYNTEEKNTSFVMAATELQVHKISVHSSQKNGKTDFYVTDLLSGKPIKGAIIKAYSENQNRRGEFYGDLDNESVPMKTAKTDKTGWATMDVQRARIEITYKEDVINSSVYNYYYESQAADVNQYHITTDRGLYRPGQTVYFKIIGSKGFDNNFKVAANDKVTVVLENYNLGNIGTLTGNTNEFGSFSGEFILPPNASGDFQIKVNNTNVNNIRVEEYKRPSFEVIIDPITDGAGFGQDLKITGKVMALSGVPVQSANVAVTITYQPYYWYRYSEPISSDLEKYDTVVKTDAQGRFSLNFKANDNSKGQGKGYTIEAKATAQSGETHESQGFVHIGKSIFKGSINTTSVLIGNTELKASATISNQQDAPQEKGTGTFNLYAVKSAIDMREERPWSKTQYSEKTDEEIANLFPEIKFQTLDVVANSTNGNLLATINVKNGEEIDFSKYCEEDDKFRLEFSSNVAEYPFDKTETSVYIITKKTKLNDGIWMHTSKQTAEPEDEIDIYFGSAFKKMYAVLEIYAGTDLFSREFVKIKKTKKHTLKITEEMRGNVSIHLFGSLRAKSFSTATNIIVPFTNKELNIEFSTIRKTISPGQEEEISIKILDTKKIAAAETELLASMYDASLDQINGGFDWNFFPYQSKYNYVNWNYLPYNQRVAYGGTDNEYYGNDLYYLNANSATYGTYGWSGKGSRDIRLYAPQSMPAMSEMSDKESITEDAMFKLAATGSATGSIVNTISSIPGEGKKAPAPKPPRIRSNFNETAFFKPNLRTDANGNLNFTYTVPDAMTRWKLQVLAHDKALRIGNVTELLETRKEVMAQAYTPRFFREGDTIVVRATVNNLLPEEIIPNVSLAMIDPYTDKDISTQFGILNSTTRPIASNNSGEFQWKVIVPFGFSVVKYRLIAKNGIHSDGEEKVIPILSNREFVQETQSFTIASRGTTVTTLEKLAKNKSTTLKTDRLSVEFTGSPLWNIILSMPYLMEFPHECAEQTFARIFANGIGSQIVEASPAIQNLFKTWRETKPEVFAAELEKNTELKNILLNETPWVRDAVSETEQRKRIAMLFDRKRMDDEFTESINKLNLMLNSDGGLPWFIGGKSNPYIALHIASGIQEANFENEILDQIHARLTAYLDEYFESEYQQMIKEYKTIKPSLSPTHILWLLTRSKDENQKAKTTASSTYYTQLLETEWVKQSINTQAMAGTYFELIGKHELSKKVIASMQNRATKKNFSMYWAENKNGRLWHQSAIETQARTITFFTLMKAPQADIKAMKSFLLQNKRANAWETTKETTMACQVLLTDGTAVTNIDYPQIYVGSENIQAPQLLQKNGGYFKKSWAGAEVNNTMATVRVESTSDQFQYGAIHWSYYEDLSKITRASNGISIERTYYVKNEKNELRKVDITNLKVGQKLIVELNFKVDQDLDYVHLKDQRAAGVEPVNQISGYIYQDGISGYQSIKDASVNFFFDHLNKGNHKVNYEVFVTSEGQLSMGLATLNCMYAPEFKGHSDGVRVVVKP